MSELHLFDAIYLDIEKDRRKAKWLIDKSDWNVYPVINCFEQRNPDCDEDYDNVLQQIESYREFGHNLVLDFIRYTKFNFNYQRITSVVKFASNLYTDLKVTILPFGEFYGQNHWQLKKYATICPMLYYSPFWFGIMKWWYGECEPVIKAWDTNSMTMNECIAKSGGNYSLFRYGTYANI